MSIGIYNSSTLYGVYGQNDVVCNSTKGDSTTNSSQKTTSDKSSCDVVNISAEARSAATASTAANYSFFTVRTFDMPNGVKATLGTAKNETGETVAQLSYADKSGEQHNIFLDKSATLRMNENGEIEVIEYDKNEEMTEIVGELNISTGEKVAIERNVRNIQGSDADEVFILLPSNSKDVDTATRHWKVEAGNGNNVIVDLSGEDVSINTGNGNDTIIGIGGTHYRVDSGDGDDIIELDGRVISNVNGGDGNDKISIKGTAYIRTVDGGNGDDTVEITGNVIGGMVAGGAGSDEITIHGDIAGGQVYGDRHDTQKAGNDVITIHGSVMHGEVHTGDGDNTVYVQGAYDAAIIGGSGNDSISAGRVINTYIDGGDGDDTFQVESLDASVLVGGNGNNHIHVKGAFGGEIHGGKRKASSQEQEADGKENEPSEFTQAIADAAIGLTDNSAESMDDGNNTIIVDGAFNSQIYGGNGNDSITVGNARTTYIGGGDGDDVISVDFLDDSVLVGGKGDNAIHVLNSRTSEIYGGSKPAASKDKEDNDNAEGELSEYEQSLADAAIGIGENDADGNGSAVTPEKETIIPIQEEDISESTPAIEDTRSHATRYSGRYASGATSRSQTGLSLTI